MGKANKCQVPALKNVGNCRVVIHGAARLEFEGGRLVSLGPETDAPREWTEMRKLLAQIVGIYLFKRQ
jgi:hypothetical protein